jgi:hypothetical protein
LLSDACHLPCLPQGETSIADLCPGGVIPSSWPVDGFAGPKRLRVEADGARRRANPFLDIIRRDMLCSTATHPWRFGRRCRELGADTSTSAPERTSPRTLQPGRRCSAWRTGNRAVRCVSGIQLFRDCCRAGWIPGCLVGSSGCALLDADASLSRIRVSDEHSDF